MHDTSMRKTVMLYDLCRHSSCRCSKGIAYRPSRTHAVNGNGDLEDTRASLCDFTENDAGTGTGKILEITEQRCV